MIMIRVLFTIEIMVGMIIIIIKIMIIKIMILMIRVITHLALIETSTEQTDVGEMDRASIRSGDRRKSGLIFNQQIGEV